MADKSAMIEALRRRKQQNAPLTEEENGAGLPLAFLDATGFNMGDHVVSGLNSLLPGGDTWKNEMEIANLIQDRYQQRAPGERMRREALGDVEP